MNSDEKGVPGVPGCPGWGWDAFSTGSGSVSAAQGGCPGCPGWLTNYRGCVCACVCAHVPVIDCQITRDSRDTRGSGAVNAEKKASPPVVGVLPPAGTPRDAVGHPSREVFAE